MVQSSRMDSDPRTRMQNDRFVAHCGIQLLDMQPGTATCRLQIEPHHLNGVGIVQGGALFTLADFAFAAASNSHGTPALALRCDISFLKAVSSGCLTAVAREISNSRKISLYRVDIRGDDGDLVATFSGTAYKKGLPPGDPPAADHE